MLRRPREPGLFGSPEEVAGKLDILRGHCEAEGRDYSTITPTVLVRTHPFDERDRFLRDLDALAALGVGVIDLIPLTDDPAGYVRRLGEEIVPEIKSRG